MTRRIRNAFITTVATGAIATTVGCYQCGDDLQPYGATCNPPGAFGQSPSCPEEVPEDGGACPALAAACSYEAEAVTARCAEEGWELDTFSAHCPDELPVNGGSCEEVFRSEACTYADATVCGGEAATAQCITEEGGVRLWTVEILACEAPAEVCESIEHIDICKAHAACRWRGSGVVFPCIPA